MTRKIELPKEFKDGMRSLSRALSERDAIGAFDRCMVAGEGCKEPAIAAHCIPRTTLELIKNHKNEVVGVDSTPPQNPGQWIVDIHLKPRNIYSFNAAPWACENHDKIFTPVDSQDIDVQDDRHLFLMIYKIAVYLTQRSMHSSERLATPMLDPAVPTPTGFAEGMREFWENAAREMTMSSARIINIKWKMDQMLVNEIYDSITYRVAMWQTVPAMAAAGMTLVPGPGNSVEWYGGNSLIPVWILLLPQKHGQTLITASPKGTEQFTRDIHEGMPKNGRKMLQKGNNWTRLICKKVLTNATDIAVSHERFFQTTYHERDRLQEYIFVRRSDFSRKRINELPNLLSVR